MGKSFENPLTGLTEGPDAEIKSTTRAVESILNPEDDKDKEQKVKEKIEAIRKQSIEDGNILSEEEIKEQAKKEVEEGISVNK